MSNDTLEQTQKIKRDLARADRSVIPVNLIYPADTSKPAIMLEGPIGPKEALEAIRKAAE